MSSLPYLDSYWVLPSHFLAGAYPGDIDEEKARHKVQSLIHAGIDTIIDLTQPDDTFCPYLGLLVQEVADFEVKVERLNFPISDFDVPTLEMMTNILDTIDKHLAAGKHIYVHCVGGIGRTGTVVGCYLVRHGLTGEAALIELENLRREAASWWKHSPESDYQIEFVRKWGIGK